MSNRHLNRDGVGLGLKISKSLANALGGDIQVTSKEGKGSSFTLILPYAKARSETVKNMMESSTSIIPTVDTHQINQFFTRSKDSLSKKLSMFGS